MATIFREDEFKDFLESPESNTNSSGARSSCISRLRYIQKKYGGIDSSLTPLKIDDLVDLLNNSKNERNRHNSKEGINSLKAALNKYLMFLSINHSHGLEDDLIEILHAKAISTTERSTLFKARLGQGKFRNELIELWRCCSISGYTDTTMLIASHIKPWSKSNNTERLDKYNGLLLTPNLDKAFDNGKITFDNKGKIVISKSLKEPESLGIHDTLFIKFKSNKTEEYMAFHRDHVFNE